MSLKTVLLLTLILVAILPEACNQKPMEKEINVFQVFAKVRAHEFHPLNEDNSLTNDRNLKTTGLADLNNEDCVMSIFL